MSTIREIIKRLFFICMAASLNTSESKLLGLKQLQISQRPQVVTRQSNYYKCYCPPIKPNSVQVSTLLADNADVDLERVVVYLYKNKATNKLVLFTPGKEKQKQIPDMSYDAGDYLVTIDAETIVELYENILHTMSVQHHFAKTNSHRVMNYTTNSASVVLNPAAAIKITEKTLSAMQKPKPVIHRDQLNIYKNSNEHLYYTKKNEMKSPVTMTPEKFKQKPLHNKGVNVRETIKANYNSEPGSYNFNIWFKEQLKLLPELANPNNEFINGDTLKTRIVRILREHDLYLVDEYVRDEYGNKFDMSYFQILRIVIEEKLRNTRGEWFPAHEKGLMLVYLNPPYIFGVIPLKKSYFLRSFQTSAQKIVPGKTPTAIKTIYGNKVYGARNHLLRLFNKDKSLKTTSLSTHPEKTEGDNINDDAVTLQKEDNVRSFELATDLLETISKYFKPNVITDVVKRLIDAHNADVNKPGYRIIGGNAALHSGTPLNNKARSGFEAT